MRSAFMEDAIVADGPWGNGNGDVPSVLVTSASSVSSSGTSSSMNTEESSASFFEEKSSTLGSLIGIGGDSILADSEHVQIGAARTRGHLLDFHQSSGTNQSISFKKESVHSFGAKLCGLFQCGACRGLCNSCDDPSESPSCGTKNGNTHVGLNGQTINPGSLGHLLVADTKAASSSQVNSSLAEEQVCDHCRQRQCLSRELGLLLSSCLDDDTLVTKGKKRLTIMSSSTSTDPFQMPSMLPMKNQKRLPVNMCKMGCISYMWARCRVQERCVNV